MQRLSWALLLAILGLACSGKNTPLNPASKDTIQTINWETARLILDRGTDANGRETSLTAVHPDTLQPVYDVERTFDERGNKLSEKFFGDAAKKILLSSEEWTYFPGTSSAETHQKETTDIVEGHKKCIAEVFDEPGHLLARTTLASACSDGLIARAMARE